MDYRTRRTASWELDHFCPEQVHGLPYAEASDVFLIRLLLLELCAGRALFADDDHQLMVANVMQALLPLDGFLRVPPGLRTVLSQALDSDPSERQADVAFLGQQIGDTWAAQRPSAPQSTFATGPLQ